jgi:hypothetical protein
MTLAFKVAIFGQLPPGQTFHVILMELIAERFVEQQWR